MKVCVVALFAVTFATYQAIPASAPPSQGKISVRLAAEVHQVNATSSDVVFGAVVDALVLPSQWFTSRPTLDVARQTNGIVLTWSGSDATLESAAAPNGSWVSLPGRASPHVLEATNMIGSYRLRR
jgi:hypothetical protein